MNMQGAIKIKGTCRSITRKACVITLPDGRAEVFPKSLVREVGDGCVVIADWLLRKKFGITEGEPGDIDDNKETVVEHITPPYHAPLNYDNAIDELAR